MAELNAAGNITGTDGTVELATGDNAAVSVALEGIWNATVNFEVTYDGVRWDAAQVFTLAGVAAAATATTNVDRLIDARGAERVRARANPFVSGTIGVVLSAGEGVVGGGGGGGGGAVTVADGADVAQGTTTDAAVVTNVAGTVIGFLRGLVTLIAARLPAALVGGRLDVNVGASAVTQPVSGTVTANAGTGTFAVQATAAAPASVELSDGAAFYTGAKTGQLPAALVGARLDVNVGATAVTQPVSGTVTANAGTGTFPMQATAAAPGSVELSDGAAFYTAAKTGQLPAALVGARLDVNLGASPATVTTQGGAAAGAALSGNPNLIGVSDGTNIQNLKSVGTGTTAIANTGIPAVQLAVYQTGSNVNVLQAAIATGDATNGQQALSVVADVWNGATYDRPRNNVDVVDLASASRTTTQTLADIVVYNGHSLIVVLDMTVVGTGSVTLTINYKDPASGKYILLLSGAAVTTNVTNTYTINQLGLAAVANVSARADLGRIIQLVVTANNANAATYSLGHTLVS